MFKTVLQILVYNVPLYHCHCETLERPQWFLCNKNQFTVTEGTWQSVFLNPSSTVWNTTLWPGGQFELLHSWGFTSCGSGSQGFVHTQVCLVALRHEMCVCEVDLRYLDKGSYKNLHESYKMIMLLYPLVWCNHYNPVCSLLSLEWQKYLYLQRECICVTPACGSGWFLVFPKPAEGSPKGGALTEPLCVCLCPSWSPRCWWLTWLGSPTSQATRSTVALPSHGWRYSTNLGCSLFPHLGNAAGTHLLFPDLLMSLKFYPESFIPLLPARRRCRTHRIRTSIKSTEFFPLLPLKNVVPADIHG